MKFRLSHLYMLLALIACFGAGWIAGSNNRLNGDRSEPERIAQDQNPYGSVFTIADGPKSDSVAKVIRKSSNGLVSVSCGADDGIKPGYQIEFFRNSTSVIVGNGVVVLTKPDICVVRVSEPINVLEGDEARFPNLKDRF